MSDGIFNATGGACEDAEDMDLACEDEEVECYHDCNGFCMISACYGFCMISACCGQCPFEGGEKLDCEDYEEA